MISFAGEESFDGYPSMAMPSDLCAGVITSRERIIRYWTTVSDAKFRYVFAESAKTMCCVRRSQHNPNRHAIANGDRDHKTENACARAGVSYARHPCRKVGRVSVPIVSILSRLDGHGAPSTFFQCRGINRFTCWKPVHQSHMLSLLRPGWYR